MPAWIMTVLTILGAAETAAPIIEKLLSGIATFISGEFAKLFGADATGKLEGALATATQIVQTVEADLPAAIAFVNNTYPTIEALLAAEPWLAKMLFSSTQIATAVGVGRGSANKLNEVAHANVSTKPAA